MSDTTPTLFDYRNLAGADRDTIRQHADSIRSLMQRASQDIVEIGQRLLYVKKRLGHGRFLDWLNAEFDMTERTAQNFMNVARAFKSETVSDLKIGQKALYMLSAPSVPEAAREEVVAQAKKGEKITPAGAKAVITKHRPTTAATASQPAESGKGPSRPRGTGPDRPRAEPEAEAHHSSPAVPAGTPNVPTVRNCFGCMEDRPTTGVQYPGFAKNERTRHYADFSFAFCDECLAAPAGLLSSIVLTHVVRELANRDQLDRIKGLAATLRRLSDPGDTDEARTAAQNELRSIADSLDQRVSEAEEEASTT
jgi:hypothetical protein